MRRRRQQKLEKKLQQFRSRDGGPDTGGTLKIYGESLRKDVPYKTLLVSVSDPEEHSSLYRGRRQTSAETELSVKNIAFVWLFFKRLD